MQVYRLQNLAEKVTLLQATDRGVVPVVLSSRGKKKGKKKKSRMGLGMAENMAERMIEGQKAFAEELKDRFNASQKKKSDGWLLDLPANLAKAGYAAAKAVRVYRVPG
jgi:hypothetical protein